jgi:hypothetical protein
MHNESYKMALSDKQKQKKLDKKNKKRQLNKKVSSKGAQLRNKASNYSEFPIHECLVPNSLFETGIGYVVVTRKTTNGNIAISVFVVDVYCLGVKNALFKVSSESEYEHTVKPRLKESSGDDQFENIHPTCAKKLVEGAVLYAQELGFSPHRDYKDGQGIFGNIDTNSCPLKYTYGKDGKPFYIRGPNESTVQAKKIVTQLGKKCGEGNFDYLVMLEDGMLE